MNITSRISATFLFTAIAIVSFAQAYQAPEPKMNSKVMKQFLNSQIVYPEDARENKEQGVVTINYRIDESGQITARETGSSVSARIDSAALALFDLILWKPAYNYGKAVMGTGAFKIKYNVGKYESLVRKRGYDQLPRPVEEIDRSGTIYLLKHLHLAPDARLDANYISIADYISKTLVYPETACKLSISGNVKLRFIIETSGLPSNLMVIETVGGGCTEEAIRIVQQLKWSPGVKDNMAVRTCFNLSIKFDPADQLRSKHIPNQSNTGM